MKPIFLTILGILFLGIGMIGLLIPVIPGILFLFLAAALFAQLCPSLRHRLGRHPRLARFFDRIDAGERLSFFDQCKMTFYASLEAIVKKPRR
ncbi:MAG: DUF454 family protein [Pseudomonadota bacterium]